MTDISQLLVEETDGACAYCGIKDYRVLTEHHIEQMEPKDQSYDNRIILCHNCHHLYHQDKGPTLVELQEIKKRLICKILTQQGVNAIKESYRKGRVVASPYLVNHLIELGYMQQKEIHMTVGGVGDSGEIVGTAIYELTEPGKAFAHKWGLS